MKKFKSVLLVFLTASCVCFMACGGIDGTYKFSSMTIEGVTINAGERYNGIILDEEIIIIKLEKNGTCELNGFGQNTTGVWGASDNGYVIVEEDGTKTPFAINGNYLTMLNENNVIVLKK